MAETDSELIRRICSGETEVFAVLVHRYEHLARAAAFRVVRDHDCADDVVQTSLIAAFETLSALRKPENFGGWLLGIVRRQAALAVRQRVRSPVVLGEPESVSAGMENWRHPESIELLEAIEKLPEHEQVVVGLRYFQGNTVEEIAGITGRPVGTVTKQLSRAHARLHEILGEGESR